jgi:hypothetical protein
MATHEYFAPVRLNKRRLANELDALGSKVERVSPAVNWTKKDSDGVEYIEVEPAKLIIDAPDSVSEAEVQAILDAHNPQKTDDDQRQDDEDDRAEQLLLRALKRGKKEVKDALKDATK